MTDIRLCLGRLSCCHKERSFRFLRLVGCIISTRGSLDPEISSYSYRAAKSSSLLRVGLRCPEKSQPEPVLRDEISFTSLGRCGQTAAILDVSLPGGHFRQPQGPMVHTILVLWPGNFMLPIPSEIQALSMVTQETQLSAQTLHLIKQIE